ncbi:MAG: LD-carboxypeptidase [Myxococcota bacterium]
MPRIRKARALRHGATLGLAAPAGPIDRDRLEAGEEWIRALGFEPHRREDLTARRGYLAGDDARRAAEFMELVDDPAVDGIVCVRGGYGCHRIIGQLVARRVRRAAKPLVGYSDATTLLLWQWRRAGLMGFHGPMLDRSASLSAESADALVAALTGDGRPPRLVGKAIAPGVAEGRLVGGSLALLAASLGSPWEIDTRGAILLLEEIAEEPYRIDRMLQQLCVAGKLASLVGVGVGQMVACEGTRYPTPDVGEVLDEILTPLGIPIVADLAFGHADHNLVWPFGGRALIDGERGEIEVLEAGVRTD